MRTNTMNQNATVNSATRNRMSRLNQNLAALDERFEARLTMSQPNATAASGYPTRGAVLRPDSIDSARVEPSTRLHTAMAAMHNTSASAAARIVSRSARTAIRSSWPNRRTARKKGRTLRCDPSACSVELRSRYASKLATRSESTRVNARSALTRGDSLDDLRDLAGADGAAALTNREAEALFHGDRLDQLDR